MKKMVAIVYALILCGCTDSPEDLDASASQKYPEFPSLPTSRSESIHVTDSMSWWFWEGDGGCFGTLTDGRSTIELHAEAELCESIDYKEGAEAAIEIVYDPSKQYVPDKKTYAITRFIK